MLPALLLGSLQTLALALLAPLVTGIIKKIKALLQCRRGPGIFQPYRDIYKMFQKQPLLSEHSSWISRITPYICFASVLTAAAIIPFVSVPAPLAFAGDAILVAYLFGLARFFLALAALDTGSSFGGMGSSREMMVSSLAEPALMMGIFVAAMSAGSTDLSRIAISGLTDPLLLRPVGILAFAGLAIVAIAETGRIPVDNPDTHLELTMIHEGMLLEYSGRHLALLTWGASLKQLLIFSLMANLYLPSGLASGLQAPAIAMALGLWLVKVLVLALGAAVVESSFAKMRLFRVPHLLAASFLLSILALISIQVL